MEAPCIWTTGYAIPYVNWCVRLDGSVHAREEPIHTSPHLSCVNVCGNPCTLQLRQHAAMRGPAAEEAAAQESTQAELEEIQQALAGALDAHGSPPVKVELLFPQKVCNVCEPYILWL